MKFNFIKNLKISEIAQSIGNTLNIVKKAIPIYKEMKPYISKEKKLINKEEQLKKESTQTETYNDSLTFFQ